MQIVAENKGIERIIITTKFISMPFCENCGNALTCEMKFCENCGENTENTIDIKNSELYGYNVKQIQNLIEIEVAVAQGFSIDNPMAVTKSADLYPSLWNPDKFLELFPPNERGITTCPRCLGKGIVQNLDIIRLNMQAYWGAGDCFYCDGVGKVNIQKFQTHDVVGMGGEIADYDWERYFGHLPQQSKTYIGNDIPNKKLKAFLKEFDTFIDDDVHHYEHYLYYDDTIFGKGDKGILLSAHEDSVLIYLSDSQKDNQMRIGLSNVLRIEYYYSSDFFITTKEGNLTKHSFTRCKPLFESIIKFCEDYFECNP